MGLQISRRGRQYLETAQTLLRAAQTMTDDAVAFQLKSLADNYKQQAVKFSLTDLAKPAARSIARPNESDDLI